jgi:hypothetical protein
MAPRVKAVKDVREVVHTERVALVEDDGTHEQRVVPIASNTETHR